jgi:hypothetical protein
MTDKLTAISLSVLWYNIVLTNGCERIGVCVQGNLDVPGLLDV